MHTQLEVTPTGRLVERRRQLLNAAHEQCRSLRFPHDASSSEDRRILACSLQLQDALLRKALRQDTIQGQRTTPPVLDFSSMEPRIAETCAFDPEHPYGR